MSSCSPRFDDQGQVLHRQGQDQGRQTDHCPRSSDTRILQAEVREREEELRLASHRGTEAPSQLREEAANDFDDFVDESNPLLTRLRREHPGYDLRNLAADFHLSRQGHGAGFFDRGLGEIGDELQSRARAYGPLDVLVDGRDHID